MVFRLPGDTARSCPGQACVKRVVSEAGPMKIVTFVRPDDTPLDIKPLGDVEECGEESVAAKRPASQYCQTTRRLRGPRTSHTGRGAGGAEWANATTLVIRDLKHTSPAVILQRHCVTPCRPKTDFGRVNFLWLCWGRALIISQIGFASAARRQWR